MAPYRAHMRCFGDDHDDYAAYHDTEWGVPIHDEHGLYERLCLEAFQSGLSWLVILRKRANFRAAFANFDPEVVATYDETDIQRLLGDAGIVRNRLKIEATIANAQATLTLREGPKPLHELVWSYAPDPATREPPATWADVPALTPESTALAKELKRAGFRFLGPTTVYAAMQACGLVNDHLRSCDAAAASCR